MFGLGYLYKKMQELRAFLFRHNASDFKAPFRFLFAFLRFLWMTLEDFWHNRGTQKSAALAYTSILSLFPLLAVISIFATYFYQGGPEEAEDMVVRLLSRYVLPHEPDPALIDGAAAATMPAGKAQAVPSLEENIRTSFRVFRENAGKIAGVGSTGLLVMALALFAACESFFNQIWKVQARRSILRRFSAFSTALVALPIVIALGTLVSRFFSDQLDLFSMNPAVDGFVLYWTSLASKVAPFLFMWIGLTLAIILIPNTGVDWIPALIGGLVSALLWTMAKEIFFSYIGMNPVRRTIFEAFGATLVFLVWLYFLWFVVLIGVEVAYLKQNFSIVLREQFKTGQDLLRDPRLFILVLGRIGESFYRDEGGIRFDELRSKTNLRESELEDIVAELKKRDMVAAREDNRLILHRPPEHLALKEIFDIACCGTLLAGPEQVPDPVRQNLQKMDEVLPEHFGKMTLKDLLHRSEKPV